MNKFRYIALILTIVLSTFQQTHAAPKECSDLLSVFFHDTGIGTFTSSNQAVDINELFTSLEEAVSKDDPSLGERSFQPLAELMIGLGTHLHENGAKDGLRVLASLLRARLISEDNRPYLATNPNTRPRSAWTGQMHEWLVKIFFLVDDIDLKNYIIKTVYNTKIPGASDKAIAELISHPFTKLEVQLYFNRFRNPPDPSMAAPSLSDNALQKLDWMASDI